MPHEFQINEELEINATPEQVWQAIADGPGVDSWFMGRTEIEPRDGGRVSFTMGGATERSTVTAWEPGKHLAYRSDTNPDGTFMAFEYLIEGRAGGSTVLRFVHNGFLGDDWEDQYDALRKGDPMYLHKLAAYVEHFAGRISRHNMLVLGPQVDAQRMWAAFEGALGLAATPVVGDRVRVAVPGLASTDGVVEFAALPTYLGVRTSDGIYTFMHGFHDTVVVEHHNFADDADGASIEQAWQSWLGTQFA